MEKIMYIFSVILIFVSSILLKKTNKKINIVYTIICLIGIYFCYNGLWAWILHILNININLLSIGIVNYIVSGGLIAITIKNKEIQKYSFYKKDLIIVFIMIVITSRFISFKEVRYMTVDGAVHFTAAKSFYENQKLFKDVDIETYSHQPNPIHMPLAYVNEGLIMQVFADVIGEVDLYKIFLFFEVLVYLICGSLFFFIISENLKNKMDYFLSYSITIIYVLGYLLHSVLSGFHYLNYAIMLVFIIILLTKKQDKVKIKECYLISIYTLLNLGIMLSYYLFVPIIFGGLFIKYIIDFKLSKKLMIYTLITMVLPGIIGTNYYFFSDSINSILGSGIKNEGYIFRSIWSGIIIFIPFTIYYIYNKIRNKEYDDILVIYTILIIVAMWLLLKAHQIGLVSTYYYFKIYYLMWGIFLICNFKAMSKFSFENIEARIIPIVLIIVYYLMMIRSSIIAKENFRFDQLWLNNKESLTTITQIYEVNKKFINREEIALPNRIVKMANFIEDNIENEEEAILLIETNKVNDWVTALLNDCTSIDLNTKSKKEILENEIQKYSDGEFNYLVDTINIYSKTDKDEIIYNEDGIVIYKKTK